MCTYFIAISKYVHVLYSYGQKKIQFDMTIVIIIVWRHLRMALICTLIHSLSCLLQALRTPSLASLASLILSSFLSTGKTMFLMAISTQSALNSFHACNKICNIKQFCIFQTHALSWVLNIYSNHLNTPTLKIWSFNFSDTFLSNFQMIWSQD